MCIFYLLHYFFVELVSGVPGEKIFYGNTAKKQIDFKKHVGAAQAFVFYVNLSGPQKEVVAGGIAYTPKSTSEEAVVTCYSKPSKILGRYSKCTYIPFQIAIFN